MHKQNVNMVILKSIPISMELKRYILHKFDRMVKNNGQQYACDKMKHLSEVLRAYRADYNRIAHVDAWLKRSGFKVNGWLRMLFQYMDTHPQYVLQLVKLYCGPNDPIISVDSSACSQHRALEEARQVNTRTPVFLQKWAHHILREKAWSVADWMIFMIYPETIPDWAKSYVTNHRYDEYRAYVKKWKNILWVNPVANDDPELQRRMRDRIPCAEMYVDYGRGITSIDENQVSQSYTDDIRNFCEMQYYLDLPASEGGNGLSSQDYSYLLSILDPSISSFLLDYEESPLPGGTFLDGMYVGQIHHIPKKGTVKRRAIGPPNRIVQYGFIPVDLQLERMVRKLAKARDCTFKQTRLNTYIESRVHNDNLYAGCVDLHQATDFLPFNWMKTIWSEAFDGRVSEMVSSSWRLFEHASSGAWLNEGFRDSWTTGQPLGAYPSFKCLAISHNLVVEALAFTLGYGHSPYAILGDDIIITNKKLRKAYIRLMNNAGIPLSLNKSYEGRLVEFAGQIFIKNMAPFYTTDQRAITWNSLFDYQWATGIHIPYENLPKKIRRKIAKLCQLNEKSRDTKRSYELAYLYGVQPRGSNVSWTGDLSLNDLLAELMNRLDEDHHRKEMLPRMAYEPWSGISPDSFGHPVALGHYQYANKNGFFQRYRKPESEWFRYKYRPIETNKVITVAARIIAETREAAQLAGSG